MALAKRYKPIEVEPRLIEKWQKEGTYNFLPNSAMPVFSIDTPPATVSGNLHMGHTFSYSHPDFFARYQRMRGANVFYPMGFDDNGLPTGRLVEKQLGCKASRLGREKFVEECISISETIESEYKAIWREMGISIDWRYSYRTISEESRKISQISFLKLFEQNLVYRKEAPTIWCPECGTAIAQADLEDMIQPAEYFYLKFPLVETQKPTNLKKDYIQIATTRPELLPACVAIFIHPDDQRYQALRGMHATVPIFNHVVPILTDSKVEPAKGTGIVMCCTFGDQMDMNWWNSYDLPLTEVLDRQGKFTQSAGQLHGLTIDEARKTIIKILVEENHVINTSKISHSVRVHERCQTPVEYIITQQWFIRILDSKDKLLQAGKRVKWHPHHMLNRYTTWVENISWDWCISRQRFFGVPFPLWYCEKCNQVITATIEQLPVDPTNNTPTSPCKHCGSTRFTPETDVMDTWATSSLTPQISARWLQEPEFYQKISPFSLRPQAHEIIRTWTFYTIVKSTYHFNSLPWENILISGWGIAGEGMGKISKSRGGGPWEPIEMINLYSADAVRYWASSTGPGKDAVISEEKIKTGSKLINKLWNVARFSAPFIEQYSSNGIPDLLTTADRWALSKIQNVIKEATYYFDNYDYAAAKSEIESFFWLYADNYIEMAKQRLYSSSPEQEGAIFTLQQVLLTLIKLFAPIMPFVTERIYLDLFLNNKKTDQEPKERSIHRTSWPVPQENLINAHYEAAGELSIESASQLRRYKSEHHLPLNTELDMIHVELSDSTILESIESSIPDLKSITRSRNILINQMKHSLVDIIYKNETIQIAIEIN